MLPFKKISAGRAAIGFAAILLLSGLFTLLLSQNIQPGGAPNNGAVAAADSGAGGAGTPPGVVTIDQYNPLAVTNAQFRVSGMNFDRRFAGNGWGEFLDVVFTLENLTAQDRDLYVFVAAYQETDAVDERQRQWVPYPRWRPRDFERESFLVQHIAVSPADIAEDKIWTEQDPDFQRQQTILNRMRNSVAGNIPIEAFRPPFWKYEQYMMKHPNEGLRITLYGETSPGPDKALLTNWIPPTQEELRNRVHKTLIQHKYTVDATRRQTIFRSHHFTRFRPNYSFFNRAAILIFDAKDADASIQQQQRGPQPGEPVIDPLVYKRVYAFNTPLRNN
jgi:hypothetical protein